jgi:predicted phage terminase large subunit-like protein
VQLAAVLQRVADGELRRLMVFMPPRHGKSELVSRLFSAYYLYRYPEKWVGINSYGADLAYTLSRASRNFYLECGGPISSDAKAVKQWETGVGGGLWAAGVGGPITGKGWHLGIIDDPLKNAEEAASLTLREKQREWYGSTFYTREEPDSDDNPDGALIVIQTRWHEEDLSGWLLHEEADDEPERWHIVCFEAIKEEEPQRFPESCTVESDPRKTGEALCPERRPLEKLLRIARRIGAYFWNALYQQRPRPREGGFFKRAWFTIVGAAPRDAKRVRYWDKAGAAPGKGDYTVGVLMALDEDGIFYIEDVVRGQWPASERNQIIRQTAAMDREKYDRVATWIEQPPGLGKESCDTVIKLLAGFNVKADPVHGDKTERAEPFQSQAEARNVRLVSGLWNHDFLEELGGFPNASHDDQVDGAAGAFRKLVGSRSWGVS